MKENDVLRGIPGLRLKPWGLARRHLLTGAALGLGAASRAGSSAAASEQAVSWKGGGPIIRDFDDPLLELGRLLKKAAEIEHDLIVQYLYAAFSLKPAYEGLVGFGASSATDPLGVAIQEMQHLRAVNQLRAELGYAPVLSRHARS